MLASFGAVVATIALSAYMFLAMEITLAIPLYAIFLYTISQTNFQNPVPRKRQLQFGFLSSLLILSRLDATIVILLFLLVLPFMYRVALKELASFYLYFCLGGFLVAVYLEINYYYFDTVFTVSSLSKFLKVKPGINWELLKNLPFLHDSLYAIVLLPLGAILLWLRRKNLSRSAVFFVLLVFLFPVVYYSIITYKTDWFLFRWYLYPLPFVFFAVVALVSEYIRIKIKIAPALALISVCALTVVYVLRDTTNWKPNPNSPYSHSKLLQPFAKSHPGIYAMGDRAGIMAYMINEPVIQLEGLAADMTMYKFIKAESDLKTALAHYKVRYLIETNSITESPEKDSCYQIEEPHTGQAGNNSAKMRMTLCEEPIWVQTTSENSGAGVVTNVFEVK
jgi:hypothetical protein